MIRREKSEVLAGQRGSPVKGAGQALFGEIGKGFAVALAAMKMITPPREVGDIESELIEEADDKSLEARALVRSTDII